MQKKIIFSAIFSCFFLTLVLPSLSFGFSFSSKDIPGGWIKQIVPDPNTPGTYYAAGYNIYKSKDNGKTWTIKSFPLPPLDANGFYGSHWLTHYAHSVAVSCGNPDLLVAGDGADTPAWYSSDGGDSWTSVNPSGTGDNGKTLTVAASKYDPLVFFCAYFSDMAVDDPQKLYMSGDGGRTWHQTGLDITRGMTITDILHISSYTLLVSVINSSCSDPSTERVEDITMSGSIYISTDNGASFFQSGFSSATYGMAWDGTNIWNTASCGVIYRSSDKGRTWDYQKDLARDIYYMQNRHYRIYFSSAASPAVFITDAYFSYTDITGAHNNFGVYINTTTAFPSGNWYFKSAPAETDPVRGYRGAITCGALVPDTGNSWNSWIIGYRFGGVFYTLDNGATYTQAPGIATRNISYGIKDSMNSTDRLYAIADGLVFYSGDNGDTWSMCVSTPGIQSVSFVSGDTNNTKAIATYCTAVWENNPKVLMTNDNGADGFSTVLYTFQIDNMESSHYKGFTNLLVNPSNPQVMYVGFIRGKSSDADLPPSGHFLFKSADGGHTWNPLTGLTSSGLIEIAMDPKNPGILYASCGYSGPGFGNASGGQYEGFYRSEDSGATWTQIGGPAPADTYLQYLVIDENNTDNIWGYFFGPVTTCLYRSRDAGLTWTACPRFTVVVSSGDVVEENSGETRIFYYNPVFFMTSRNYIFKSDDSGETWKNIATIPGTNWIFGDSYSNTPSSSTALRRGQAVGGLYSSIFAGTEKGLYNLRGLGSSDVSSKPYSGNIIKVYNYPNPFNPKSGQSTTIRYSLVDQANSITVKIFTLSGREVWKEEIEGAALKAGGRSHGIEWDGKNTGGSYCSPGVYLAVVNVDGKRINNKIVILY